MPMKCGAFHDRCHAEVAGGREAGPVVIGGVAQPNAGRVMPGDVAAVRGGVGAPGEALAGLKEHRRAAKVSAPAAKGPRVGHTGEALLALLADGEWRGTGFLNGMLRSARGYSTNAGPAPALRRLMWAGLVERRDGTNGFEWRLASGEALGSRERQAMADE